MKTIVWTVLLTLLTTFSTEAQIQAVAFYYTHLEGTYTFQRGVADFDPETQTALIEMSQMRDGRNLIAADCQGGNQLYLVVQKSAGKTTVTGFAIKNLPSQSWTEINCREKASAQPDHPGAGSYECQAGGEPRWDCQADQSGSLEICYFYCTTGKLVVRLPSGV